MTHPIRYLVTGATGFIGPHLIRELSSQGHFCRCLVRDPKKIATIESNNLEVFAGDITRPETLNGVAREIDCVLHLATLGHLNNFTVSPQMFEAVNVHGTINVMNAALDAGVKRVVHCSSVAAMGICKDNPATEESRCIPHHPYGKSKLKAEEAILKMVSSRHLPACIIRFSMVYGPGDWRDMLKLTRMAKKGLFPKVGNRPKLTPLIHVDDAVHGILLAAERGRIGETYLITNAESEPFDHLRKLILESLGIRRPSLFVPEKLALGVATLMESIFTRLGWAPPVSRKNIESTLADRVFSIRKAEKELGFSPTIDPAVGIRQTVQWYQSKGWV
ncbi:RmlD substrate binding domain protein [delta proteobacterium NaphS2]|nr:RmlD substrate binding domain protein [delta proteobacterium NaphS2]